MLGFKPGTSPVPSKYAVHYASNWAILAWMLRLKVYTVSGLVIYDFIYFVKRKTTCCLASCAIFLYRKSINQTGALIQGRLYVHVLSLLTSTCSLYMSLGTCMYLVKCTYRCLYNGPKIGKNIIITKQWGSKYQPLKNRNIWIPTIPKPNQCITSIRADFFIWVFFNYLTFCFTLKNITIKNK